MEERNMEDEWIPVVDIPHPGGWQRIATSMGYHHTDPHLMRRVETRRRQRRSDGLNRQIRLDSPVDPTPTDIIGFGNRLDEVIEVLWDQQPIQAPPRPQPRPRPPTRGGNPGKGGVRLP